MSREFNIGDVCRIRQWDDMATEYGVAPWGSIKCRESFIPSMRYLCGKPFTVKLKPNGIYYSEEGTEGNWNISGDMLELVHEEIPIDFNPLVDLLTFIEGE